jgi:hypothetical protein
MDWDNFNQLPSYAMASIKNKSAVTEKITPLWICFFFFGLVIGRSSQRNEAIKLDYKKKCKHKHSVCQNKSVSAYEFFVFLGVIIISGAVGKGGEALFKKEADRLKDGVFRLSPGIDLSPHMRMRRFEDFKSYYTGFH